MKRTFTPALAAALSLALLTACGPADPAASQPAGSVSSSASASSEQTEPEELHAPSSGELKLNKFKNIQLSTLSPSIQLERGEGWSVRYVLHNKEQVTRAEVADDTFYFSSTFKLTPGLDLKDCQLVITVPEDAVLEDIQLSTAAGSITLSDLTCRELELESVSGDLLLDHVKSESLELETTSGGVNAAACTAEKAEAESVSGPVRLDGTYGKAELSSVSGTCELYAELAEEARIETVSGNVTAQAPVDHLTVESVGSITVDGQKQKGKTFTSGEGQPSLSVKSVSGKVNVDQNVLVMIE